MNPFLQTLRNLGPARLAAMGAVLIGLIAFFIFIAGRMATPGMGLLYSSLSQTDAAQISQQLDNQKIPYELSSDGSAISVPAAQVSKLRMQMAVAGLPRGGSIGYEIFDQPEGFGTTSFVQSINHLRALEGELARTIGTLSQIQTARVHLVLPKRELFGRGEQKATASVFLRLRGGGTLGKEQIASIQNLVSASVPGLAPDQIAIVDDRGTLLARAAGSNGAAGANATSHEEMRANFEGEQAQKIEDLLGKTLGYGRVRAQVSADMDFDRITTNSESYDPDGQVLRSTQTTSEDSTSSSDGAGVSITNNLPGNSAAQGPAGGNKSTRTEETNNYEISKTIKSQVRESGIVKRLSVAVLVDGTYTTAEDGTQTYKARNEDEMKQITALVRSAINVDDKRGDSVQVSNMPFAAPDALAAEDNTQLMGFPKADLMQLAQTLILALVALLVILLVVRPLMKKAFEGGMTALPDGTNVVQRLTSASAGGQAALAPPQGALAQSAMQNETGDTIDQLIDIGRVEGRVRASAVKKVGEIIDKHPEESVSILRNWMYTAER